MFLHSLHIRQKQIFCSFICNLTLDGIAYTFGVFLVPLMEYFELKEKGPISMIGNNNYTMEMCTCNSTIQIGIWRYLDLTSLAQLHTFLVPIKAKLLLGGILAGTIQLVGPFVALLVNKYAFEKHHSL